MEGWLRVGGGGVGGGVGVEGVGVGDDQGGGCRGRDPSSGFCVGNGVTTPCTRCRVILAVLVVWIHDSNKRLNIGSLLSPLVRLLMGWRGGSGGWGRGSGWSGGGRGVEASAAPQAVRACLRRRYSLLERAVSVLVFNITFYRSYELAVI